MIKCAFNHNKRRREACCFKATRYNNKTKDKAAQFMEFLDVLTTTMKNLKTTSDLFKGVTASTCTMEGSMQV